MIEIYYDDSSITAIHKKEIVGAFQFGDREYSNNLALQDMNILPDYKRAGIGSKLMKVAVEVFEYFDIPVESHTIRRGNAGFSLTEDGRKLVEHCFKVGILTDEFKPQNDLYLDTPDDYES
ncbi:GNAT family N-acetyltransferase [Candidatus Margulisiibacteriota bacterium]